MKPCLSSMLSTYSLQWSLYRHQARQIDRAVGSTSAAFQRYEREYRKATRTFVSELRRADVDKRVAERDIVFVGDYHTLKQAQDTYLSLVRAAMRSRRPVALAVEFVEGRNQPHVDAYLSGRCSLAALATRVGYRPNTPFDLWPRFAPILEFAKQHRLTVRAIDRRATGPRSLKTRDAFAAQCIAEVATRDDHPLVMVLIGQYHVAPQHLPAAVRRALKATPRTSLVVYQNAEGPYWKLAKQGQTRVEAVSMSPEVVSLMEASPIVAQRSFLNYVESEPSVDDDTVHETFQHVATQLAKLAKTSVREALDDVAVVTPGQSGVFERIAKRGGYHRQELPALKRLLLAHESALLGRARCVWLQSPSMHLVAREAARLVFQTSAARPAHDGATAEDFWAMCLEETFVASLVSTLLPPREVQTQAHWASHFRSSKALKPTAAFVLALTSAAGLPPAELRRLTPSRDRRLMRSVARALGELIASHLTAQQRRQLYLRAPTASAEISAFCVRLLSVLSGSPGRHVAYRDASTALETSPT